MSDKKAALSNFENAFHTFERFLSAPIQDDRDEAGVIQSFEFTFELCWKSIQKYSEDQGVRVASPKQAFSFAAQDQLIPASEEELWLAMLDDRNLTAHTYKREVAADVLSRLGKYILPLRAMLKNIKKKWKA